MKHGNVKARQAPLELIIRSQNLVRPGMRPICHISTYCIMHLNHHKYTNLSRTDMYLFTSRHSEHKKYNIVSKVTGSAL